MSSVIHGSALKFHLIQQQSLPKKANTGIMRGFSYCFHSKKKKKESFLKPSHTLYFMRSQQRINCSFPCEPDSEGRVPRAEAGVAYFELDCHVPERQAVHQVRSVLCVKANRSSLDCGADDLSRYLLHLSLKSYPFFIQWEITHRALLTLLTGRLSVL